MLSWPHRRERHCRGDLTWFFARGVIKTAIAGAGLTLIAVLTRSLIPGMIVHALIDIGSGTLGYRILRHESPAPP